MKYFLFIFILISFDKVQSQDISEPLILVKEYFNNDLNDYKSVLTGDAVRQDYDPQKIEDKIEKKFELLDENENSSVIAVTFSDEELETNLYVFLEKNEEWKINAFRSLSLPGFYFDMVTKYKGLDIEGLKKEHSKEIETGRLKFDSLKSHTNKNDSLYKGFDTLNFENAINEFYSEEMFVAMILIMRLTLSSDEKLVQHFEKYINQFENFEREISSDTAFINKEEWRIKEKTKYTNNLYELSIAQVYKNKEENFIRFLIGGILENSVGYLYCENPNDLPKMSENGFIMIKKLSDNWYLYKTT